MAYPMNITILPRAVVLVTHIVVMCFTIRSTIAVDIVLPNAIKEELHVAEGKNEHEEHVSGKLHQHKSTAPGNIETLNHPLYSDRYGSVQKDIPGNFEAVRTSENILHSKDTDTESVSRMPSIDQWDNGVSNNFGSINDGESVRLPNTDGYYHHEMNPNESDNGPWEHDRATYTHVQAARFPKNKMFEAGLSNIMRQSRHVGSLFPETASAKVAISGRSSQQSSYHTKKDFIHTANIEHVLLNTNGLPQKSTGSNLKFEYPLERNEQTLQESFSSELRKRIDSVSGSPNGDKLSPILTNSLGNSRSNKSIKAPNVPAGGGDIDVSKQEATKTINGSFGAAGASVYVTRSLGQTGIDDLRETDLIRTLNNTTTDLYTDSFRQGEVDLIRTNSKMNSSNSTNGKDSASIYRAYSDMHKYNPREGDPSDNANIPTDLSNTVHHIVSFADPPKPSDSVLKHEFVPSDTTGVSSSAQQKAASGHNFKHYWALPLVNSQRDEGNGIRMQQQSKSGSNKETLNPYGFIVPQPVRDQESSRWPTGKHTSPGNVLVPNDSRPKLSTLTQLDLTTNNLRHLPIQKTNDYNKILHYFSVSNRAHAEGTDAKKNVSGTSKLKRIGNKHDVFYHIQDGHASPRFTQVRTDKPDGTSSGNDHSPTEQLHWGPGNKANVGPFGPNKHQAVQQSRVDLVVNEKVETLHRVPLGRNRKLGRSIGLFHMNRDKVVEIPHINPNNYTAIQRQSDTGQEWSNKVNVDHGNSTGIEHSFMDIGLTNGHKAPPASLQMNSKPESISSSDLNVQFADDAILSKTPEKAFTRSINIDPLSSQMSPKYKSKSDWSHTGFDHKEQSKRFVHKLFSQQHRTTQIRDFGQGSMQKQDKISEIDHLPVKLEKNVNNEGFLSRTTVGPSSHGDRKKRSADIERHNLFHRPTMSEPTQPPAVAKSDGAKHEKSVNTALSKDEIIPDSNHFTSLDPDDENSKLNPHRSIIRHLQHKLLKHHTRGHRRVRIKNRNLSTDVQKGAVINGNVYQGSHSRRPVYKYRKH